MSTLIDIDVKDTSETLLAANSDRQYKIKDIWIHSLSANPVTVELFLDRFGDGTSISRKLYYDLAPNDNLFTQFESEYDLDNNSILTAICTDAADGVSIAVLGEVISR